MIIMWHVEDGDCGDGDDDDVEDGDCDDDKISR